MTSPPPALSTMGSAMFFGSIFFATAALSVKCMATGCFPRVSKAAHNPRSTALDFSSFLSWYTFLHHMSVFGLILLYAYLCEYHPPYPHSTKSYDRDEFFFLTALLFLASFFTLKKNKSARVMADNLHPPALAATTTLAKVEGAETETATTDNKDTLKRKSSAASPPNDTDLDDLLVDQKEEKENQSSNGYFLAKAVEPIDEATDVLNRDQTEEWKGWMQFMFLLYHYYHAEEVYNSIRVYITCYVWMTGFGNFSFFYLKADYGSIRVMQMIWRLNFLVIFLVLTQGTTYILYYICLLHTYFFSMVYLTMRIGKSVNYTKYGIRIKMMIVALMIFIIFDLDSGGTIFRGMHYLFLGEYPMLGANSGAMWEWYFRSSLDHYSTYIGMIFALNYPCMSLFFRKLEAQPFWRHVLGKILVGIAFGAATIWWIMGPFRHGKFDYNQTNAYYAFVPLFSYIYFRNCTPWLRSNTLDLLHQIGKSTLETYLMQHHVWLTSDAKSLLTLIPGYPKINFLVVTVIYFILSRRLYSMTLFLRGMVLPNNREACIRNLIILFGTIGGFLGLAAVLQAANHLNLYTVMITSVIFGFILFEVVVNRTWSTFSAEPDSSSRVHHGGNGVGGFLSSTQSFAIPVSGTLAVAILGLVISHSVHTGASKILPLPASCDAYVQKGRWIPVDACTEDTRGIAYREFGMGNLGTCLPQSEIYAWAFEAAPSDSYCRLAQRDTKSLLTTLNRRNVTFVGDSVVRHLYHSMCRQVGDKTAGAYNTTMGKWMDLSRQYKKATLDFRWAPFTDLMVEMVKNIAANDPRPDIIVLGGGPWDRLHKYNTTAEQDTLQNQIKALKSELQAIKEKGVSVVWVIPTTINTAGLLTEEKRANIREDQLVELRALYEKHEIPNVASFVLDGQVFTTQRVGESYDGVHYPLSVYDGGAQILANAFDWLLPGDPIKEPFSPPHPGKMANPYLGFIVMCFVVVGVFFMDGFCGMSYFAAIVAPSCAPINLFDEAFSLLHQEKGLPAIPGVSSTRSSKIDKFSDRGIDPEANEELKSFLAKKEGQRK